MSELASRYMAELTNEGMPCERCGGNGEVDNPKKDDPPMRWTTEEETGERGRMKCLACSGWFEKTSKCDSCGGTGWDFWVEKKTVEHVVWPATKITCPKCKGKAHYRTDAERLKEMETQMEKLEEERKEKGEKKTGIWMAALSLMATRKKDEEGKKS